MISRTYYDNINNLKNTDPQLHSILAESNTKHMQTLSIGSHEIKNMLSFITSSYQLISKQHPETSSFRFWDELGYTIEELVGFMDRTSLYRYCFNINKSYINLADIIYELPDRLDDSHPSSVRNFEFTIDSNVKSLMFDGDYEKLLIAFNEIIENCFDATKNHDTIKISLYCENNEIHIIIANEGAFPEIKYSDPYSNEKCYERTDPEILCKEFYSTKQKHAGIGLSIANLVFMLHDGSIYFEQNGTESSVHILLPEGK